MCRLYLLRVYIQSVNTAILINFLWLAPVSSFRGIILNDGLFVPRKKDVCSRLEFEAIDVLIQQTGSLFLRPLFRHGDSHFKLAKWVSKLRVVVVDHNIQIREVVKTTTLEQDPPNHKIVGGVCSHPTLLNVKWWCLYYIATPLSSSKK